MMFQCNMHEYMDMLVQSKHALGSPYQVGERHLHEFDHFIMEKFPDAETITKESAEAWAVKRPYEKVGTQRQRITPMRDLAILMNKLGKNAFVFPIKQLPKGSRYPVHIYSQQEILAIFEQVDHCQISHAVPYRHMVMPILFRMLYCCGLRPGEARRLKLKDVDLENGILSILDSKNGNDRLVPMNNELTAMCIQYTKSAHTLSPESAPFLLGAGNREITNDNLNSNFRRFLRKAGISHGGRGKGPRLYDFRHTFAVNSLRKMVLDGKDMDAYYPVLQIYMGHSFFKYTEYYLRLTKDMFPDISAKIEEKFSHIISDELGEENGQETN